jgi:hypothetical protein
MADSIFGKIGDFLGKNRPWYKLPALLAAPALVQMRNELREKNLHDTEEPPLATRRPGDPLPPNVKDQRTLDGTYNDLTCPHMGAKNRRFGRNFPLEKTFPDTANLLNPNPREVSLALMTRQEFKPATILNLLAASWIQFMVHDWFAHKKSASKSIDIPIRDTDAWPDKPMRIAATEPDPAPAGSTRPPAYANDNTHWWDASQLYGCDDATGSNIRMHVNGKLKVSADAKVPLNPGTGFEITGFTDNHWIGLSMLHGLFALEHNTICEMLKGKHPDWSDEQLFEKARLINTAVLAKIHTVEWTPAILPQEAIAMGMHTNWYGITDEELQDVLKFLNDDEVLGGIIGSPTDHHGAPYCLTEEFVSVYRMHPLIPDEFTIRSAATGEVLGNYPLPEVAGQKGRKVFEKFSPVDLFYSFGVAHPGAVRLNNYPRFLQNLNRDDGSRFDLAAVDILRDRERGVPRYNEFRRLLRKDPVKSFEELAGDPAVAEEIRKVYNGDLEKVDLMVGLYAEPLPEGFGFSETAFRIFVLMASRRLKSDRFFTNDWGPDTYTEEGIAWIRDNGMATVLRRHFPQLAGALHGVENPFAPWKAAGQIRASAAGEA